MTKWRRQWRLLLAIPLLLILVAGGFLAWSTVQNTPTAAAEAAVESDDVVVVDSDPWLVFSPALKTPTSGLIFYPGGLVPPVAYAPPARAIAAEGYLVVIVPMPFNLAVAAPERAADVIAAYPDVERWVLGGHSLGGAMAARFTDEHPQAVAGLLLWASYPATENDLSQRTLPVVSIYGSEDGLATPVEIRASTALLPPNTDFVEIEGGNHSQFGYYGNGLQRGDNPATISRESQQSKIVEASLALLRSLAQRANAASSSSP